MVLIVKQKHFIDSHKACTFFFVLFLIFFYERFENQTLFVYLALHGGYGFLWLLKSRIFGDRQWEQPCSAGYALVIWSSLSLYWITPFLIAKDNIEVAPWYIAVSILVYIFGVFFHFSSDMQKHTQLSLKKGLITDGMFKKCRNTNYFGELLIYSGFSMLAQSYIPFLALGSFVLFFWYPNMRRKDKSLSRYSEFKEYKEGSSLFFPYIF